jgi:hypothetical protein
MSIRIEIIIPDSLVYEDGVVAHMKALGFVRGLHVWKPEDLNAAVDHIAEALDVAEMSNADTGDASGYTSAPTIAFVGGSGSGATAERFAQEYADKIKAEVVDETGTISESAFARAAAAPAKPTAMDGARERGRAGPGHRRRTNAQIEADDAYFAAAPVQPPAPGSAELLEQLWSDGEISTGEERINPEDAADEAAETAARAGDKPTIEDLRAAVGRYTEKFGAKASIDNIRTIVGMPIIEVPEKEIGAAIARVEAAIDGHAAPEQAKPADLPTEPVHATKVDVVEAIMAYGKKYDGVSDDPKKMPCTTEDMPKIFVATFGAGVVGLKTAPQTPEGFGKAMTAVYEAVRDNPFKRAVRS